MVESSVIKLLNTSCGKIVSRLTCSERSPARGNRRNLTHLCNLLSSKAQYVRTTSRRGFRSGEAMSSRADIHLFVRTSRNRPRGEDQRSSHHVRCVRRPIDGETRCQPTITDKSFQPSTIRFRRVAARSATSRRGWEAAERIFSFSLARALGCSHFVPPRSRCRPRHFFRAGAVRRTHTVL